MHFLLLYALLFFKAVFRLSLPFPKPIFSQRALHTDSVSERFTPLEALYKCLNTIQYTCIGRTCLKNLPSSVNLINLQPDLPFWQRSDTSWPFWCQQPQFQRSQLPSLHCALFDRSSHPKTNWLDIFKTSPHDVILKHVRLLVPKDTFKTFLSNAM